MTFEEWKQKKDDAFNKQHKTAELPASESGDAAFPPQPEWLFPGQLCELTFSRGKFSWRTRQADKADEAYAEFRKRE